MGQALLFYLFSTILIFCSLVVVLGRNPMHSVLFLILGFINAAGLLLLEQAEFLAMLLIVVYIGAVAVLFLFVVMMLDLSNKKRHKWMTRYGFMGSLVGGLLVTELIMAVGIHFSASASDFTLGIKNSAFKAKGASTNTHALGHLIYTDYFLIFQIGGLILLVAMIGAIVLTLRTRRGVHRQDIHQQLSRNSKNTLEVKKVNFRQGVPL